MLPLIIVVVAFKLLLLVLVVELDLEQPTIRLVVTSNMKNDVKTMRIFIAILLKLYVYKSLINYPHGNFVRFMGHNIIKSVFTQRKSSSYCYNSLLCVGFERYPNVV
jgi:hypothetical protein